MLVAIIATVVAIASGIYMYTKKDATIDVKSKPNIIGSWISDSAKFSSNSLATNLIISTDSTNTISLDFAKDSLLTVNNDTNKLKYQVINDSLFIKETNRVSNFAINWLNDSSLILKNDSLTTFYLTRKY